MLELFPHFLQIPTYDGPHCIHCSYTTLVGWCDGTEHEIKNCISSLLSRIGYGWIARLSIQWVNSQLNSAKLELRMMTLAISRVMFFVRFSLFPRETLWPISLWTGWLNHFLFIFSLCAFLVGEDALKNSNKTYGSWWTNWKGKVIAGGASVYLLPLLFHLEMKKMMMERCNWSCMKQNFSFVYKKWAIW